MLRRAVRIALWAMAIFVGGSIAIVVVYRFVPPPGTPLMLIRKFDDRYTGRVDKRWVPIERISPNLIRAVITAEDSRFCTHHGFDFEEIRKALRERKRRNGIRGASTITQQTAKNLFLWPSRGYVRKAVEAWFALLIEVFWPKKRIMEVYLNVAEWGDGTYGVEAATRRYYRKSARSLTPSQAAYMAAVLPNARVFSPVRPSSVTHQRAALIMGRLHQVVLVTPDLCP